MEVPRVLAGMWLCEDAESAAVVPCAQRPMIWGDRTGIGAAVAAWAGDVGGMWHVAPRAALLPVVRLVQADSEYK